MSSEANTRIKRLIIRHCGNAHPHICKYLINKHNFDDLCRFYRDSGSKSKIKHFKDIFFDLFYIFRNIGYIRSANEIIAIGPMSINIALLSKLRTLPNCRRIYWFGLFIHSPLWLKVARIIIKLLDSDKILYVVFSMHEVNLYHDLIGLQRNRILYIPYGDISDRKKKFTPDKAESPFGAEAYFFSGGYSNRDYISLIEVFKNLPYKLLIVCSSLNKELDSIVVPSNILILRDISYELFEAYAKNSVACIVPIANDTGAAGQSSLLCYMENKKVIIATDTGVIREYIENEKSGILVKNNRKAMLEAIKRVAEAPDQYKYCGEEAYKKYIDFFSGEAIRSKLDELINRY